MRRIGTCSQIKQAVIFCGGVGSRLGSLTKRIPKPLIKISKKPFLENIIFQYSRFGVKEVILLCSYKKELFFKKYHKKKLFNCKIFCIDEGDQKGRVLALKNANKKLKNFFFLSNGDTLLNFNLLDLTKNFSNSRLANIALIKKKAKNKVSNIHLKKNGQVLFLQKKSNLVNSGYFLINKKILNFIKKKNKDIKFEEDFLSRLKKNSVKGIKVDSKEFLDIGIPSTLGKAKKFLNRFYNKPAIFLDRDGVINKEIGYLYQYKDLQYINNIFETVKYLNSKNFYIFVITNQSGIGRGYYTDKDVRILHSKMLNDFRSRGSNIDEFIYAPYYSKSRKKFSMVDMKMRKPGTGMIDHLFKNWPIQKKGSCIIGDQDSDKFLAINSKLNFVYVKRNIDLKKKLIRILK